MVASVIDVSRSSPDELNVHVVSANNTSRVRTRTIHFTVELPFTPSKYTSPVESIVVGR